MAAGYRRGKTGSASDGQRLPVPLYQCKTDYFPGQRGHFTFYKPPFSFFFLFRGLTFILKAEGRQRDTDRGGRDRKRRTDEKHLRDAGNIWFHIRRPREEIANRQNSYVLIYFI